MATNLLISGGPTHDFAATTSVLVDVLDEAGVRSTVFEDPHAALAALAGHPSDWDLITVNALRWEMGADRYAPLRDRWSFTLGDAEAEALLQHVRTGGALLACHTAAICFDAHPSWTACIGAAWSWDRSSHPALGPAQISPTDAGRNHPITHGIETFTTIDEVYGFLDTDLDLEPLLTGAHGGVDHPVLWARSVGNGRVVTDLLGHDAVAMTQTQHHEILRRAARWLLEPAPDRSEATP